MNAAERKDWLSAVAECFPELKFGPLTETLEGLDAGSAGGIWEGGVSAGAESKSLAVRYFGAGDYAAWRRAAASAFKLELPEGVAPSDGLPWLTVEWNAVAGEPARILIGSGREARVFTGASKKPAGLLFRPERYTPRLLEDAALAKVLSDFDALSPVADLVFPLSTDGTGKPKPLPEWALRLKTPLPWPLFVRLDLAAAFTAEASQLSFFLLARKVSELGFEEAKLWAYFRA